MFHITQLEVFLNKVIQIQIHHKILVVMVLVVDQVMPERILMELVQV